MASAGAAGSRGAGDDVDRPGALLGVGHLLADDPELCAALETAARAAARLLQIPDVRLWLHDAAANVLRLAARLPPGGAPIDLAVPLEDSLVGRVLGRERPVVARRVAEHPLWSDVPPGAGRPASAVFVPIRHRRRPLALLTALSTRPGAFAAADVRALQSFAPQVAAAIRTTQLCQEARRQVRQLGAILDVNRRLALGPELAEILARITEEAARLIGAEGATLRLLEGNELVRVPTCGVGESIRVRGRLRIGESLIGRVVATGGPIISADPGCDPRHDPEHRSQARARGLCAWLGVPLRGRGRVVGALAVYTRRERRFTQADVTLLEAFADQATIAVENTRAFRRERERRRQLDTLRGLTSIVVNAVAVEALAQRIVDAVPDAFGPDSGVIGGTISTVDRQRRLLRAHAITNAPIAHQALGILGRPLDQFESVFVPPKNLQHEVALSGEPRDGRHLIEFLASMVPGAAARAIERLAGMRGGVAQPVRAYGQTIGVFLFALTKPVGAVTEAERALMADFANTAGIALENVRLYAAAERLTLTDAVTGIANRRHFDRALAEEVARADRRGYPLALLLIDIDHFKAYNDVHGHQAGDDALRAVADVLRRSMRSTDFVARYGGEEFAALLADTGVAGARAAAEKARRAVADASLGLTISVGGAVRRAAEGAAPTAAPEAALIAAADAALYAAKRGGRDRTAIS